MTKKEKSIILNKISFYKGLSLASPNETSKNYNNSLSVAVKRLADELGISRKEIAGAENKAISIYAPKEYGALIKIAVMMINKDYISEAELSETVFSRKSIRTLMQAKIYNDIDLERFENLYNIEMFKIDKAVREHGEIAR